MPRSNPKQLSSPIISNNTPISKLKINSKHDSKTDRIQRLMFPIDSITAHSMTGRMSMLDSCVTPALCSCAHYSCSRATPAMLTTCKSTARMWAHCWTVSRAMPRAIRPCSTSPRCVRTIHRVIYYFFGVRFNLSNEISLKYTVLFP